MNFFKTIETQIKLHLRRHPILKGVIHRHLLNAAEIALLPITTASHIGQSHNLRRRYKSTGSAEAMASRYIDFTCDATKSLDLGCGSNIRNPFKAASLHGVDILSNLVDGAKQANLVVEPIPFNDNTFDYCTAFDFIEHIPRQTWINGEQKAPFIELMNEIHRVLKPGGLFLHSTPAYPAKEAFQDPTHVNIITEDTMPKYFCSPRTWGAKLGYGFSGDFELVEQRWVRKTWVVSIMRANK